MDLIATERAVFGKKTKHLRNSGVIPAELYGHKIENKHLSVQSKEFAAIFKEAGESTIINLKSGSETYPVLIHDIDTNPVTGEIRNIDFYKINMEETITLTIPLEFEGDAPGVKLGGVLVKALQELEVECLPAKIPHTIPVNLAGLNEIGKALHVSDLPQIEGVTVLTEPTTVIALVNEPEEETEEQQAVDIDSVVVEGEEKRKEKEQEKEEEKAE